jgi:hypothetical protein
MALSSAVQHSRKRSQIITWTDDDGVAINLTGATLTGFKRDRHGADTTITGVLAVTNAAAGIFSWAYSAADVAVPGAYRVVFTASYTDSLDEVSPFHAWRVLEGKNIASVSPSASASAS